MTGIATAPLPAADRVLAVCAHPDDETFGLGGLLATSTAGGADVAVLCLTRGEASDLDAAAHDLAPVRAAELHAASRELGVESARIRDFPDGGLPQVPVERLAREVSVEIGDHRPDLLLTFHPGGITGHPDLLQATTASRLAATAARVPLWSCYVPATVAEGSTPSSQAGFVPVTPQPGDVRVRVDRERQHAAMTCHTAMGVTILVLARQLAPVRGVQLVAGSWCGRGHGRVRFRSRRAAGTL